MNYAEPVIKQEKIAELQRYLKVGDKMKLRYRKMKYDVQDAPIETSAVGFKTIRLKLPFLVVFTDGTTMQWSDVYKSWLEFREIRRAKNV